MSRYDNARQYDAYQVKVTEKLLDLRQYIERHINCTPYEETIVHITNVDAAREAMTCGLLAMEERYGASSEEAASIREALAQLGGPLHPRTSYVQPARSSST